MNWCPVRDSTRVAAVKGKRFTVIQRNSAAWIATYRTLRTHGNTCWTFNGRAIFCKPGKPRRDAEPVNVTVDPPKRSLPRYSCRSLQNHRAAPPPIESRSAMISEEGTDSLHASSSRQRISNRMNRPLAVLHERYEPVFISSAVIKVLLRHHRRRLLASAAVADNRIHVLIILCCCGMLDLNQYSIHRLGRRGLFRGGRMTTLLGFSSLDPPETSLFPPKRSQR
jgi:hypothetical protein